MQIPNIIELINSILDERNPNDLFQIIISLINIFEQCNKNGFKVEQIKNDLLSYKQDIIDGLNETRNMIEKPINCQLNAIDEYINRIDEMIEQILKYN